MEFYFERINGKQFTDTALPVSRAFLFGDGFFTTGIIKYGKIIDLELHLSRLTRSASRLKFSDLNLNILNEKLEYHCKKEERAGFRLTVSRTQTERGYALSKNQTPLYFLQIFNKPSPPKNFAEAFFAKTPISINSLTAGIKHLNRLDNVLAASEIREANQEALMCHNETVICGSRSNLFVKVSDTWVTPIISIAGIEGITRQKVLAYFKKSGIRCLEQIITRKHVLNAEAAFLTNSLVNIWPVDKIGESKLSLDAAIQIQNGFLREYCLEN